MHYSQNTNGFYDVAIHGAVMPSDVVQITQATYDALMIAQADGKHIEADSIGRPVAVEYPAPQATVPDSITMRQARLALLAAGLLSAVNAGISGMGESVQIEWEFAATVDRASPLVVTLSAALGLDSAALDALFTAGGAL